MTDYKLNQKKKKNVYCTLSMWIERYSRRIADIIILSATLRTYNLNTY